MSTVQGLEFISPANYMYIPLNCYCLGYVVQFPCRSDESLRFRRTWLYNAFEGEWKSGVNVNPIMLVEKLQRCSRNESVIMVKYNIDRVSRFINWG